MEELISRLDQALNEQNKLICVFDIDSTIFNVSPRNQEIFDLFCSTNLNAREVLHKVSSGYRLKQRDWGLRPYLSHASLSDKLRADAREFWKRHFFAGTFLGSDQPYSKVVDWIQALHSKKARIMYLTGRDNKRMRKGTLLQLKTWRLPLDRDEDLITKPLKGLVDGEYKHNELKLILEENPEHHVLFFDNEPSVLDHCQFENERDRYQAFFINSTHSERSEPKKHWPVINVEDYPTLLEKLTV
jgi:hypothetical protein